MRFRVSPLSYFASRNHRILVNCKLAEKKTKIVLIKDEGLITAMDAICPHSGGPLENGVVEAVLEDLEDFGSNGCQGSVKSGGKSKALVCPWHSYRFDLSSGRSLDDEIFTASVYPVHVDLEDDVYLELPDHGSLIESIRVFTVDHPLDEVPQLSANLANLSTTEATATENESVDEIVDRLKGMPLFDWCLAILGCENAENKVQLTLELQKRWTSNEITQIKSKDSSTTKVPDRPARNKDLEFVDPSKVKRRGKGSGLTSRITILHALANVEQWAIDLAIDIMCRFSTESFQSPDGVNFPIADQREFFTDFIKVAAEEAKHFTYLVERLNALGAKYGDLPCHQGLWDAATQTKDSLMARLAIVHMVRLHITYNLKLYF